MLLLIFVFSAQDGESSGGLSYNLTVWLVTVFERIKGHSTVGADFDACVTFWEFYVRKAAHVAEYALLTCTVYLPLYVIPSSIRKNLATEASIYALSKIKKRNKYHTESRCLLNIWERLLLTVPITVMLAAADELHQYYIPGRCGVYTDVLIDSMGIALSVLLILIVYMIQSLSRARAIHSSRVRGS